MALEESPPPTPLFHSMFNEALTLDAGSGATGLGAGLVVFCVIDRIIIATGILLIATFDASVSKLKGNSGFLRIRRALKRAGVSARRSGDPRKHRSRLVRSHDLHRGNDARG